MPNWEYCAITYNADYRGAPPNGSWVWSAELESAAEKVSFQAEISTVTALSLLGAEGWELSDVIVSQVAYRDNSNQNAAGVKRAVYIMKRVTEAGQVDPTKGAISARSEELVKKKQVTIEAAAEAEAASTKAAEERAKAAWPEADRQNVDNEDDSRENWFTFTTTGLSLVELLIKNPKLDRPANAWLRDTHFAHSSGTPRKISLLLSPVPGSRGESWITENKLLEDNEEIPSTRELVDGLIQYLKQNPQLCLDSSVRLRTKDAAAEFGRVDVSGIPGSQVLVIACSRSPQGFADIGLAAIKPAE